MDRHLIFGGQLADPARYPYYVRLDLDGSFGCGGSLVRPDFVLTAAHCIPPGVDHHRLTAVVGAYNIESTGAEHDVLEVYPHLAYDGIITMSNDIALLKITPVTENTSLVSFQSSRDFLQLGDSVTTMGLGITEEDIFAEDLKEVQLQIVDTKICDEQLFLRVDQRSMFCAIGEDEFGNTEDTCQGDSGGPVVVLGNTPEEDIQVGVVSWGERCGGSKPGVYANVAYMLPWIESIICKYSDSPPEGCEIKIDTEVVPIILDPDVDICRDFAGAFYADWWHQFQRCDWLREQGRISLYCKESNEAWVHCPLTCSKCTYEADDDFYFESTNYDQSSGPTAIIAVFVLSLILLCILLSYFGCCHCCCRRFRQNRGQSKGEASSIDEVKPPNEIVAEQANDQSHVQESSPAE